MVLWLSLVGLAAYFGFAVLLGKMLAFSSGEESPTRKALHEVPKSASAHDDRGAAFFARERA